MQMRDCFADGKHQLMFIEFAPEQHRQYFCGVLRRADRVFQFGKSLLVMMAQFRKAFVQSADDAVVRG